jgi:hypothetical protein
VLLPGLFPGIGSLRVDPYRRRSVDTETADVCASLHFFNQAMCCIFIPDIVAVPLFPPLLFG